MSKALFETEVIIDMADEEPVRLCRMTFTEHELHAVAKVLASGAVTMNHRDARAIASHFYESWLATGIRASDGQD